MSESLLLYKDSARYHITRNQYHCLLQKEKQQQQQKTRRGETKNNNQKRRELQISAFVQEFYVPGLTQLLMDDTV